MTRDHQRKQRQRRIFGDGGEDSGAPLPSSFAQVLLEEIADHGTRTVSELMPAAAHEMTSQRKLLARMYGGTGDEPVRLYAEDMLAWLGDLGFAVSANGDWRPGAKFAYGKPLVIRSSRVKAQRMFALVYEKDERETRTASARQRNDVRQLLHQLRTPGHDDLEELVWSIRQFGPQAELAPVTDQHDLILAGHRRIQAAELAGVEFPTVKRKFADSDEGDLERLMFAIVSNLGTRPLTQEDRARIARYLYREQNWSQARIAGILGVSQQQVSVDVTRTSNDHGGPARGRSRKTATKVTPELEKDVAERVAAGQPVPRGELAKKHHVGESTVQDAHIREQGRAEGRAEARAELEAQREPSTEPEPEHKHEWACRICGQEFG